MTLDDMRYMCVELGLDLVVEASPSSRDFYVCVYNYADDVGGDGESESFMEAALAALSDYKSKIK